MESIAGCPADWPCVLLLHTVRWKLRMNLRVVQSLFVSLDYILFKNVIHCINGHYFKF